MVYPKINEIINKKNTLSTISKNKSKKKKKGKIKRKKNDSRAEI